MDIEFRRNGRLLAVLQVGRMEGPPPEIGVEPEAYYEYRLTPLDAEWDDHVRSIRGQAVVEPEKNPAKELAEVIGHVLFNATT